MQEHFQPAILYQILAYIFENRPCIPGLKVFYTHAERLLVQLSFYRRSIVSVPFYARGEHIRTLGFRTLTILLNIDHPHGEIGIIRFGNFSKTAFKKRFLEGSPLAAYHLKLR